jgi:phosphatidylglycerol:prolipoprotein diacylglycerol transferase
MNGCCYGAPTKMPWGIQFPKGHESYPQYVHPTEIYDSLLNFALYGFLAWLYRRRKFDGQIFGVYLVCYAILRSFVELFRGDYTFQHYWKGMTPAQIVSIGIVLAGLLLLLIQWRKGPPTDAGVRSAMPDKACS